MLVQNRVDTFSFVALTKPDLVNFDGDKMLLCIKKENKTLEEYVHQYKYAATYVDRREAVEFASQHQDDPRALAFLKTTLKDNYEGLRKFAITVLDMKNENVKKQMADLLVDIAKNDPKKIVKASAIKELGEYKNIQFASIFKSAVNDSSYTVAGNALEALSAVDSAAAVLEAKRLSSQPAMGKLASALTYTLFDETTTDPILTKFEHMPLSQNKFALLQQVGDILENTKNMSNFRRGVDDVVAFRDAIPEAFKSQTDPIINGVLLKGLATRKKEAGHTEEFNYVISKLPEEDKKGF